MPALRIVRGRPAGDEASEPAGAAPLDPGVSRALQELIVRFEGFIRRTAGRHGLSGGDVDEVVQDLRVRIWKAFGTSELIRRAKPAYLYRAAVSASLDIIRRRRTRRDSAVSLDELHSGAGADPRNVPEERIAVSELSRAVHESLALLQESRRSVVRLHLAGYDRFEIAELLGWTEGKTRNLLYRGLEDLRQILAARGITGEGA